MYQWGDRFGFAFFLLATIIAVLTAISKPNLLVWLAVPQNAIIAVMYAVRKKETKSNRSGLWLGLMASVLPMTHYPKVISTVLLVIGLVGYALVLWSLLILGRSFGIAPADRGLVTRAPYSLVRHPMYLGELVYRGAIVLASLTLINVFLFLFMIAIQVTRICMEERIIDGYDDYRGIAHWRLLRGIW
jgi:protein-S-isoprenylcysteine O-methyltransferase Ste14